MDEEAIIWRVQYVCARACQRIVSEEDGDLSKTLGVEILDDSQIEDTSTPKKNTKAKRRCSSTSVGCCPVQLCVCLAILYLFCSNFADCKVS